MGFALTAAVLLAVAITHCAAQCTPTLTTASGRYAPSGQLCHNQLIFDETFDWFNLDLWEHEENMNGGGVRKPFLFFTANIIIHVFITI